MIWKIILLLSCFNVLVNAGGRCSGGTSSRDPKPFRNNLEWINSLQAYPKLNWDRLIREPNDDDKEAAKDALVKSGCPTNSLDELLGTSHCDMWPSHLKSDKAPYAVMSRLILRRIADSRVAYVERYPNFQVNSPLILIFESFE
ncbi:E3 ubiquitin-protein ligase NRDP1-like [Adelges cooleyi]|uniref:E3 ubiquitin-protein ligase NRDP1-like n=1 Tax=Adelges cooleyi TaxID=133065 RepID=UPI00217F8148|nr:E3 ubiquitin-protein ligase NRDP1-like [Adelges cooleyi]